MNHINQDYLKVIRVFIASPGDLDVERKVFRDAIDELNKIKCSQMGLHLEPLGWEDTLPGKGRPQEIINDDIRRCDLFVLMLWKWWGTPPGLYSSGIEEEFHITRQLNNTTGKPQILLYFKNVPKEMMADPGKQLQQVLVFRKQIEEERSFLFKPFHDSFEFERLIRLHISRWLDEKEPFAPAPDKIEITPDIEKRLHNLEQELDSVKEKVASTQHTLTKIALTKSSQALDSARSGLFTNAEVLFASSIATLKLPDTSKAADLFFERYNMQLISELLDQAQKANRDDPRSFLTARSKQKLREQWVLGKFVECYNQVSKEKIVYAEVTESPDFRLFDSEKSWLFDTEITEALDEDRRRSREIQTENEDIVFIHEADYFPVLDRLISSKCSKGYPNPTILIIYFNVLSSIYDDFTPSLFSNLHFPKKCNITQIWILDSGGNKIVQLV
jgi:hypothetical protein